MSIITLTTDFGINDNFAGIIKGVILNINPEAQIVDLCHNIAPQDIYQAGFTLKSSYSYFPKHTVHLCMVDPAVGKNRKIIACTYDGYFFLLPDNGIISIILDNNKPSEIIEITNEKFFLKPVSPTFHGRDIFAPIAAEISLNGFLKGLGPEINSWEQLEIPKTKKLTDHEIEGDIIQIDHFGNLITNIPKHMITKIEEIMIENHKITKIYKNYAEAKENEIFGIIGSTNHLEISIRNNSAAKTLQTKISTKVIIKNN